MADTSAITIVDPEDGCSEGLDISFIAGGDITAGMVVAFEATGVSRQVVKAVSGTTGQPVGVALTTVSSGGKVAVRVLGEVNVQEGAGGTIDAGDLLGDDDATLGGCVKTITTAASQSAIGIALEDIAANSHGRALIIPGYLPKSA